MDKVPVFAPAIDVPLAVLTVAAFLWHFEYWSTKRGGDSDENGISPVDLRARLPAARWRVALLFAGLLLLCWFANVAVWAIYTLPLAIGIVTALVTGGSTEGGEFGLWIIAFAIREWAFGFPESVLFPPTPTAIPTPRFEDGELTGRHGSATTPIRPTGTAEIDGNQVTVSSEDGRLIETGTPVTVTVYRNGRPCVRPRY